MHLDLWIKISLILPIIKHSNIILNSLNQYVFNSLLTKYVITKFSTYQEAYKISQNIHLQRICRFLKVFFRKGKNPHFLLMLERVIEKSVQTHTLLPIGLVNGNAGRFLHLRKMYSNFFVGP